MSYEIACRHIETIKKLDFKISIIDEAHYLKNPKAKRTSVLSPFLLQSKRIMLLTGTPALAKPKELFTLIHIIRPDIFTDFREFGMRYCDPTPNK